MEGFFGSLINGSSLCPFTSSLFILNDSIFNYSCCHSC